MGTLIQPEKGGRRARVLLAAGLLLLFWAAPSPAGQTALRIAYPDFRPFYVRADDGRLSGLFHDLITEALGRMGVRAEWEMYPWGRCQEMVRSGECDAMFTVPTEQRLRYARTHRDPLYVKTLNVFTYAGHPKLEQIAAINSVDDIQRLGLTVITYLGNGWNDEHVRTRGINIYEASKLEGVWRMLAARRGDIAIEWPGGAWPDIRHHGLERAVVQTPATLEAMPFHLLIGGKSSHVDLLSKIDAVIRSMHQDGTYERIVEGYEK